MKCIQAELEKDTSKITIPKEAKVENWISVCKKFNDDVQRVRDVKEIEDYTALYECFDEKDISFFYLVKEDRSLYKMKHRHFLDKLGIKT